MVDSTVLSKMEAAVKTDSFDSNEDNRYAHVKGPDIFNVQQILEMTFVSTCVAGPPEEFDLKGDTTINNTTKPVTFKNEFGCVAVDQFGAIRA
ncbi:MAG: YceI family protein [Paeniglutamicibacter terrestris]